MKKLIVILAIVAIASPVMATVTVSGSLSGTNGAVSYSVSGPNSVRAFALDIWVNTGTVSTVTCTSAAPLGYYIYPGSIQIVSGSVTNSGDCVCSSTYAGTKAGEGTSAVTVEMGSLYTGTSKPAASAQLLTFTISNSAAVVTVAANPARGGVVMENPAEGAGANLPITFQNVTQVAVPNVTSPAKFESTVMNADSAYAAITNAGLVYARATPTTSATVAAGKIITQVPAAGTMVAPNSTVTCTPSTGPATCATCPGDMVVNSYFNLSDMYNLRGKLTTAYNRTAAYQVDMGSQVTGDQWHICGNVVTSGGSVINLSDMYNVRGRLTTGYTAGGLYQAPFVPINNPRKTEAAMRTAITTSNLVVGTVTYAGDPTVPNGYVISTTPAYPTYRNCGTTVNILVDNTTP